MLMRKIVRLSRIEPTEGFQFAGMFPIIATACVALIANDNLPKRVGVKYAFSDLNQTKKKGCKFDFYFSVPGKSNFRAYWYSKNSQQV